MPFDHKKLIILSVAVLFLFSSKTSFAQHAGMDAVYNNMNKQFRNQQMDATMMRAAMLTNWKWGAGKGIPYEVTFKDSSVKKVISFLYNDTIQHKNYLLFVDKKFPKSDSAHRFQKIYSNQTLYVSVVLDLTSNQEIFGVPTDSCWSFKTLTGPISVYSKTYEMPDDFNTSTILSIQLNDEPSVKYTVENLKQMVGNDLKALKEIEKKNYYDAIIKYNSDVEKAATKH